MLKQWLNLVFPINRQRLHAENRILRAEKQRAEMEISFLKTRRNREEAGLSLIRHGQNYQAIKEEHEEHGYPIRALCKLGHVNRSAYYKWLRRGIPAYKTENERIADVIEKIHLESPDKGYRRIKDDLMTTLSTITTDDCSEYLVS